MTKLLLLTLLTTAAAAQTATPAPAPPVNTAPPAFSALRVSEAYRESLKQAALKYEQSLSTHCPTVDLQFHGMNARVYGGMQLDANGDLYRVVFKEFVPGTACQETRLYVAMVIVRDGKRQIIPLLPGHSAADPVLQHDAVSYANQATGAGKDCPADILDTALIGAEVTQPHTAWNEKWTLRACGKRYLVTMHFIPDATGTTIKAGAPETVVLP